MQLQILAALCGIVNSAILAAPTESINSLPGSLPSDIRHTRLDDENEHVDNPARLRGNSEIYGSVTVNATGSPGPSLFMINFYMCCLYDNVSAPILNYAPPYACIYAHNNGSCPPVNFPKLWLCTYQVGWMGGVNCSYKP